MNSLKTTSNSADQTKDIARSIGKNIKGSEVIELISDIGGGKTTFTKGLAEGMGVEDNITSPTFTIVNEYKAKNLKLYHLDFYRLSDAGIIKNEIDEVRHDHSSVVVIEWANIINDVLPADRFIIRIKAVNQDTRELTIDYPDKLNYLIPENLTS